MSDVFKTPDQYANLYESLASVSDAKRVDLIKQFEEKIARISTLTQVVAAEEEANKNAWVNKLEWDRDSLKGGLINAAAGFVSGAAKLGANLITAPAAIDLAWSVAAIPDEVKQAYARQRQNKASPEDIALLNQPMPGQSSTAEDLDNKPRTWADEIAHWQRIEGDIKKIKNAMDFSSITDNREKIRLQENLANDAKQASALYDQGDYLGAASTLIGGIFKAGGKQPGTVFQLIVENAPDLIMAASGPLGLTSSGLAYATDIFTDAVDAYRRQNQGALPPQEWILETAGWSASAALAEGVSDKLTLGAGKAAGGLADGVRKASQDAATSTFKRAVLGTTAGAVDNLPVRTALGGAIGSTGEYGTEAYQTWVENKTQGKDSSFEDLHVGGAMGALAAGPIATTVAFRDELVRSLTQKQDTDPKDDTSITPVARELIQKAVKTKDLSALLDEQSPTYNPSHAVAALYGLSQREDITEDERTQYVQQASQLLQQMEDRLDVLRQNTPEGRQETQQFLEQEQQRLAQMQQQGASEADLAEQQELINILQEELQTPLPEGQAAKQLQRDIRKLNAQIERSRLLINHLGQRQADAEIQAVAQDPQVVEQLVNQANTDVSANPNRQTPPKVQQVIEELINLSMVAPDSTAIISPEQAKALADNPNNALTEKQRTYLRTLSNAQVAINALQTLAGVERDILEGNTETGMKGLLQYRREMAALAKTGDTHGMRRLLSQLGGFAASHTGKATALSSALAEAQSKGLKRGSGIQIVKQGNNWVRATKRYSDAQLRRNGGYEIHAGSGSLVQAAQAEAAAIESTLQNLRSIQKLAMRQPVPVRSAKTRASAAMVKTSTTPVASTASKAPTTPTVPKTPTATTAPKITTAATTLVSSPAPEVSASATTSTEGEVNLESKAISVEEKPISEQPSLKEVVPELVQDETNTTPEESASEDATLNALKEKSPEGTPYTRRNLIADYFHQIKHATKPLTQIKDFLSKWKAGEVQVKDFLPEGTDLSGSTLATFIQVAETLRSVFLKQLKPKTDLDQRYLDLVQFLMEIDPKTNRATLEENLTTAMTAAVFGWVTDAAAQGRFMTKENLAAILGLDESALSQTPYSILKTFNGIVATQNTAANALGRAALQALGLKADKNAKLDLQPRLESALGMYILKAMMDTEAGILERRSYTVAQLQQMGLPAEGKPESKRHFVALKRDVNGELTGLANTILSSMRGSKGILAKLFDLQEEGALPSFKPIRNQQETTRKTHDKAPKWLKNILNKLSKQGYTVRQEMWDLLTVLDGLDPKYVLRMVGWEEVDVNTTHKTKRDKQLDTNESIERDYANAMDYIRTVVEPSEKGLEQPIYFGHSIWRNQRVGITGTVLNPQASKLHRYLVGKVGWVSKVDPADPQSYDAFRLAVLAGLGKMTQKAFNFKVGNVPDAVALSHFNHVVNDPKIAAAVDVLVKHLQGNDLTEVDAQTLVEGVQAGGEAMHTLDVLMALAQEKIAQGKPFETRLTGEVDGVANGPMLSLVMLGAGGKWAFSMLNRGGFFEQGNAHQNYSTWRGEPGSQDLYEFMTARVYRVMQDLKLPLKIQKALDYFIGKIVDTDTGETTVTGRKWIKKPLTALFFGSTMTNAINGMADEFVNGIYTAIEKVGLDGTDDQRKELIEHINTLLPKNLALDPRMTMKELMEFEFTNQQYKTLVKAFAESAGKGVAQVLKDEFQSFLYNRDVINQAAEVAFNLYETLYQAARKHYVSLVLPQDTGRTLHDLTAEQEAQVEAAVRRAFPILNTFASLQDKDPNAGISIRKTERSTAPDAAYGSLIEFGTPFKDQSKTARTRGERLMGMSPGVAMVPFSAHSLDSGISHMAAANGEVLNIHDAHVVNAAGMQETARNLNRATFRALLAYGPAMEMQWSLLKTLQGTVQVLEKLPENHPIRQAMKAVPLPKDMSLADVVQKISAVALQTEQHRTDVLSNLQAVDQYAMEGGQYEVTNANRAAAKEQGEKHQQLVQLRKQELIQLANQFNALVFGQSKTETNTPTPFVADALKSFTSVQLAQALERLAKTKVPQQANAKAVLVRMVLSPSVAAAFDVVAEAERESLVQAVIEQISSENKNRWGEEGTPIVESNPDLAEFLKKAKNGKTPAREALQFMLKQPGMLNRVQRYIADMLAKTLPDDLNIVYVTPNTPESDVMAQAVADKSRGWFVARATGGAVINVLGDAYVHSMITPELLLHEMLHGAAARKVQKYLNQMKNNTNKKTLQEPGFKATQELLQLLDIVKTYVNTNGLQDRFGPAVANVHELIAWGMTNQDFQQEVLAKVRMKSSLTQRLVNGLKAFVEKLTVLVFGNQEQPNSTQAVRNGVAVLVGNVAILMKNIQQDIEANRPNNATLNLSQQATTVDAWTTQEILAALTQDPSQPQPSPEFKAQLMDRLDAIVNKLYGPFGLFKTKALPYNNPVGVLASWKSQAWANGISPVTSRQGAANLVMSDAESFVIDQIGAVVSFALNNREPLTAAVYRELRTLYHEAKQRLTPEDFYTGTISWGQASNADKAHAIEMYNFLFRPEMVNGTRQSDFLARFAAFGLGHETVAKALGFTTKVRQVELKGKPLFQKIELLVQRLIDWINNKLTHTYEGQRADDKLNALISTLVHQEHSRRFKVQYRLSRNIDLLDVMNEVVGEGFNKVKQGVATVSSSHFVRNNSFALVRAVGTVGRIVANNRVANVLDKLAEMRNLTHKGLPGMLMGTLNYMRGPTEFVQALIRANKLRERNREETASGVARATLAAFANNGENLAQEDKAAISAVVLRSGMFYLLDAYSLADIEQILADPKKLKAEIAQLEQRLKAYPREVGFYLAQARALAYYRATGRVTSPNLLLNANNIAHLFGTSRVNQVPGAQIAEVLPTLERLITLQVLAYSKQAHRQRVSQVMRSEAQRGGENGIEFVLKLHRALHQDAKERLFHNNETLMIHGYLPEITNPHISIEVARTSKDVQRLIDAGYTMQYNIPLDPRDPNRNPAVMFSLEEGGLPSRLTASLSLTDNHAKGSRQFADFADMSTPQGQMLAAQQSREKDALTKRAKRESDTLFTNGAAFDPTQVTHNFMAPIINLDGQVTDWRYLMQEETKDGLLQRDNRFEHLLGRMAARTMDKVSTKEQNRKVIQALYEHFKNEFAFKPHNFVLVSPTSPDPVIRDLWNTLPKETQQDIYATWGASVQGMYVPYELVDAVFGYRKYSLADAFDKRAFRVGKKGGRNTRTLGEEIYVTLVETFIPARYRSRAKIYTRKAEIAWQEIVREIKDIIVVRSLTVLKDNIKSNLSLLLIYGVPIKDLVKYHVVAIRGAIAYQNDSRRLAELRYRLQLGYGTDLDKVRDEIVELEDALARNPMRELVEAGLMPTIVEDVDFHDDPYAYRSELTRWIDDKTTKVPERAKDFARTFYMSHTTSAYQILARSTQLSDFVARYVLYQHLTTRDKNPLSKAEAIQQASEAFVNYDIPLPRSLQYLDDMGFMMFIKYFLSIQRVLLRLFKERPGSMLTSVALSNMFNGLDTVTESSALHRLGNNPFDMGAANYPFTLDELATVQATMSLMK